MLLLFVTVVTVVQRSASRKCQKTRVKPENTWVFPDGRPQAQGYIIQPTCSMVVQMPPMTSTGVPQASSRCLGGIDMLSDLRFGLRLSAHSVSEWTSDASSVADRDDRQQPLMESVCDNGLVKDIHMASLIQYVESGHVQL